MSRSGSKIKGLYTYSMHTVHRNVIFLERYVIYYSNTLLNLRLYIQLRLKQNNLDAWFIMLNVIYARQRRCAIT